MRFEKKDGSFAEALKNLDISEGDILLVASDITALLFNLKTALGIRRRADVDNALHALIDAFQAAVGKSGTLLFPVFSWSWCRGDGFDIRTTRGEVGALQNWVLANRPEFVRTRHPIYSFMVWGKDADVLRAMDNQDSWSHASPFRFLHEHGAKHLLFNIEPCQALTFMHYIEQELDVPYRYPKYFFGKYTDENGNTETRMYSMFARDIGLGAGCRILNDWLVENNAAKRVHWEGNVLASVDLKASYPLIRDDILLNRGRNTVSYASGEPDLNMPRRIPFEVKGPEERTC